MWQSDGISYKKNTQVEVGASSRRFVQKIGEMTFFCGRCNTGGRGIDRFLSSVFYTPVDRLSYQTPGRRPPRVTGRVMNTVTKGWVGAPNDRAPFRIHESSRWLNRSMSVEDSDSRRFELNIWLSFCQADHGPIAGQELFFQLFFSSLQFFC